MDELIGLAFVAYLVIAVLAGILSSAAKRRVPKPLPPPPETGEALPFPVFMGPLEPEGGGGPGTQEGLEASKEPASPEGVTAEWEELPVEPMPGGKEEFPRTPQAEPQLPSTERARGRVAFTAEDLMAIGIVAGEVFGPPRSTRPYRPLGWRRR